MVFFTKAKRPQSSSIHTEPKNKRLDHRHDALDVPDVRVEVKQDGAVGCVRQPCEHVDDGAAHVLKLLRPKPPFFHLSARDAGRS